MDGDTKQAHRAELRRFVEAYRDAVAAQKATGHDEYTAYAAWRATENARTAIVIALGDPVVLLALPDDAERLDTPTIHEAFAAGVRWHANKPTEADTVLAKAALDRPATREAIASLTASATPRPDGAA